MLIVLLCAALALATFFPETRIGGLLNRLLIELPARKLGAVKRRHIAVGVLVVAAIALAHAVGKDEGMLAMTQAVGDGLGWLAAYDLTAYIDIVAIGVLIAATVHVRAALRVAAVQARQWAARSIGLLRGGVALRSHGRARRSRPASRPRRGEDSDRPAPGLAWA